jgi:hypothetical protein
MARPLVVSQSKVMQVEAEQPFRLLPLLPLDVVYHRWYWVIPPIKRVIYTDGEWRQVGQRRTMVLTGGSAVAEVIHVDPPHSFGYRLSEMRGLLAPLISHVEGRIDFFPVSAGTELNWQWTIYPRSAVASLPLSVFGRLWPGWALKALDYMADQLARPDD